jgi:hypothetical protein
MNASLVPNPGKHLLGGFDRLLSVQRPVVLAHLRSIRRGRPDASPDQIIRVLERRYLTAVTTGGALVGASAAIPAVGIGTSLALSAVETGGFLEASALFAQSITEVHGIAVEDPDRARTLVMTLILGSAGSELVTQLASEVTGTGPARSKFWGEVVTKNLPNTAVRGLADQVKKAFIRKFGVEQSGKILGRAIPFGIGAVVGGAGNHLLGRQIVRSSRAAFRAAPTVFPAGLEDFAKVTRLPRAERRAISE